MNEKGKVFRNSIFYSFSTMLVKAIGFLMLPFYTYYLTPYDYGITNIISSFINVAIYIVTFSLYSAVIRFYNNYNTDKNKLRIFLSTILIFTFLCSVMMLIISIIFRVPISKYIFDNILYFPYIFLGFISIIFISLHNIHQTILKASQKGGKLAISNISIFLIQVLLNIFFIAYLKLESAGFLLSLLLSNVIYSIYIIFDLYKNGLFTITINKKILKSSLVYSIPIIPHNLSSTISQFISRLIINKNDSTSSVGLYSVSLQFASVIDVIQVSVNHAFQPYFFKKLDEGKSVLDVKDFSKNLLQVYTIIYLAIGLFSPEIILLLIKKSYHLSWIVIPILVIGYSMKSIYYFYSNLLFYDKVGSRKIFLVSITSSLVDIILGVLRY